METLPVLARGVVVLASLALVALPPGRAEQGTRPYKVTIVKGQNEVTERVLPADPKVRVEHRYNGNMEFGVAAEGKRLTPNPDSVQTLFMIDGNIQAPQVGKSLEPLPDAPGHRKRHGGQTVWRQGDIRVTLVLEVVPGKPYQARPSGPIPRRMDTLLVTYLVENLGTVPHKVGCRTFIDTLVVQNDGALFASPTTHPGQILNGVILKDRQLPDFFEVLERPNLKDPGFKGIFTLKFASRLEGPNRVVLTNYSTRGQWDCPAQPAGDSACALFWPAQDLPPQGRRTLAWAYGQGIACTNEGRVSVAFGGSFEPGKLFTITAYVDDPIDGQTLTLVLPRGVERVEGKATQMVPLLGESGQSVLLWRCRLSRFGTYPIRIRSNNGVTQAHTVTVSPPD
jgi:hypothetical protein